jgi:hypothetical protein
VVVGVALAFRCVSISQRRDSQHPLMRNGPDLHDISATGRLNYLRT